MTIDRTTARERPGYDRDLLASKIDWEGGIVATLEYGIRSEDIEDVHLRVIWRDLETLYDKMRPLIENMSRALRQKPVRMDRDTLMCCAHYKGCIAGDHPMGSPCFVVPVAEEAHRTADTHEWQERDE